MTNNQFQVLLEEIRLLRVQVAGVEERLREVEVVQASEDMARKVRQDLHTKAELGVQWKIGIGLSIAGSVIQAILQLLGSVT
jgi:hypothetical protein